MKQNLLFVYFFLLGLSVEAQPAYKTFHHANYDIQGRRITLVADGSGVKDDIVFSNSVKDRGNASLDKFMLIKADAGGNFINPAFLHYHELDKHHMITTADNGILIAGYLNGLSPDVGLSELVVMKFDVSLHLIWGKRIPIAPRYNPYSTLNPYEREGIGIATIPRDEAGGEDYYITFNQGNPHTSYSNEGVISVIRMDETGTIAWHKMYPNPGRIGNSMILFLNDGVNDITAYPGEPHHPTPNLLCISGTRFVELTTGIGHEVFFMSIDENGDIQYNYCNTNGNHHYYAPDMIWDPNQQLLVAVFEEWNPWYGVFQPHILKLDKQLNVVESYKIENPSVYFNIVPWYQNWSVRPQSISIQTDGDYAVSFWEISGELGRQRNAGFFLFPSSSPSVIVPISFNIYRDQIYSAQKHCTSTSDYHYMVPTVHKSAGGGLSTDQPRLIKFKFGSYEPGCGGEGLDLFAVPSGGCILQEYTQIERDPEDYEYNVEIEEVDLGSDDCFTESTPNQPYYRQSKNVKPVATTISPTLLNSSSQVVNCELYSDNESFAKVSVFNAVGQLVYSEQIQVAKGVNSFPINATFAVGMNVVKVAVNNSVTTHKIIVQ